MTTVIECHPPVTAKKPAADLKALKAKQQTTWSSGDYAIIGTTLQIVGERLAEAMDLRAGQTVLDVAAGNGNATLAAARRWCEVTSTDYVPALLEAGRARALAEGLSIEPSEIDYLCRAVSRWLTKPVEPQDVVWSYAGIRPLYDDKERNRIVRLTSIEQK